MDAPFVWTHAAECPRIFFTGKSIEELKACHAPLDARFKRGPGHTLLGVEAEEKYKVMRPFKYGSYNTLKKYGARLDLDVDETCWGVAVQAFEERHRELVENPTHIIQFSQTLATLEPSKSAGPCAALLGYRTKGEFLRDYAKEVFSQITTAVAQDATPLWKISQKEETLPLAKFTDSDGNWFDKNGNALARPRLFWIGDSWFVSLETMCFEEFDEKWKSRHATRRFRTRVGLPMQKGGFSTIMWWVDSYAAKTADDLTGFDSRWAERLARFVYGFRARCSRGYGQVPAQELFDYLCRKTMLERWCVTDDGRIFVARESMPSGSRGTTVNNDMMKEIVQDYMLARHCQNQGIDAARHFPFWNGPSLMINNYTDDGCSGYDGDFVGLGSYAVRRELLSEVGVLVDKDKDVTQETTEGLKFLGATCKKWCGLYVPLYDEEKLVASFQQANVGAERLLDMAYAYYLLTVFGKTWEMWRHRYMLLKGVDYDYDMPPVDHVRKWWLGQEAPGADPLEYRAGARKELTGLELHGFNLTYGPGDVGSDCLAAPHGLQGCARVPEGNRDGPDGAQGSGRHLARPEWLGVRCEEENGQEGQGGEGHQEGGKEDQEGGQEGEEGRKEGAEAREQAQEGSLAPALVNAGQLRPCCRQSAAGAVECEVLDEEARQSHENCDVGFRPLVQRFQPGWGPRCRVSAVQSPAQSQLLGRHACCAYGARVREVPGYQGDCGGCLREQHADQRQHRWLCGV